MNGKNENSLIEDKKRKKDSFDVKINVKKTVFKHNQNTDIQNNSYSLINQSIETSNRNSISIKRKKLIKKQYFKNICKRKSIIAIILNLFFWIWSVLYFLNYKRIIIFPRGSLYDKKPIMVYSGTNSNSVIGQFISTLLFTIFNYFIVFIYPEIILFASYCTYVIYSLFNTESNKFNVNKFFLSKNTYIILVILSLGEIYKLFARKYLDI